MTRHEKINRAFTIVMTILCSVAGSLYLKGPFSQDGLFIGSAFAVLACVFGVILWFDIRANLP